ncbi:BrnA antitoxin family protein [Mesorhizobium sp. CU2]|uniref:BrnA antitoxin family protein n=1 Tax=unclassified Mesorhizobium TaxID=325217 RepID=UPI001126A620|nr:MULTISPECIES: BrnA antitoxin family protein [unclassified Mesorhizobium]TPN81792.1 BrnA antitoxin family protein [Mesorhizobium sp. CU3]TPO10032.1 BrnA antitoxin family protein [Mesorhizobium sp. CU2]
MAKPKVAKPDKGFQSGKGFTKEDWDAVSDNPEWTEGDFRDARPFAEVFPDLAESIRRSRGRPALDNPKKQVTLRLDGDVVARFREGGPGWQSRINDILRKAAGL